MSRQQPGTSTMSATRSASDTVSTSAAARPYDLILYGATGYLGSLTARYLAAHAATNLSWAVAGRDRVKLEALVDRLVTNHKGDMDRRPPGVVVASINTSELNAMAAQTRVLINTAGPFSTIGTPVVEACIENGTAYVDSTGEHVWTHEIATKLHARAKEKGAIIIPQCAIESAPPDLLSFLTTSYISARHHTPTATLRFSIEHTWPGVSGGTIASAVASLGAYGLLQIQAASRPYGSCVIPTPAHAPFPLDLPARRDAHLGALTMNPSGLADRAVVMRSWSLFETHGTPGERYGPRFSFASLTVARGICRAWLAAGAVSLALAMLALLPPLRYVLLRLAPEPGTGPEVGAEEKHFVEWRAVGYVDAEGEAGAGRAVALMRVDVDIYKTCALFVGEAAMVLVDLTRSQTTEGGGLAQRLGGGVLTPACLGWRYFEGLERAGVQIRVGDASETHGKDWTKLRSWDEWKR